MFLENVKRTTHIHVETHKAFLRNARKFLATQGPSKAIPSTTRQFRATQGKS